MKTRKIDNQIEKQIATGAIVSTDYLNRVQAIYQDDLIAVPFVKTVVRWCLDYYSQYERAPERDIAGIFEAARRAGMPDDQAELVEDFLAGLSDEFEHAELGKFNADYLLDRTAARFEARNQELLMQDVKALHARGDFAAAEALITGYKRVELPAAAGIEPLTDTDAIRRAFDTEEADPLLVLPGAFGELVGPVVRGDFVGLMGMEKIGKCLAGDTLISLPSGELKRVDEVVRDKDPYLISLDESTMLLEERPIEQYWENGKKHCLRITTRTGRQVTVTKNHPILTPDGWKHAGKLDINARIAAPRRLPYFGNLKYTDERIKLLAFMLADGGMTGNSCPSFTKQDKETQDDFKKCVAEIGDKVTQVDDITFYISNENGHKGKHNSNKTVAWFRELGLMQKGAAEKFIPPFVFKLTKEKLALFLRTLITCDGWCCPNEIGYSSASEIMLRQVAHLLLRFGILTVIRSSVVNDKRYWNLSIHDKYNMQLFLILIGFTYNKKERADILMEELRRQKRHNSFVDTIPPQISVKILNDLKKAPSELSVPFRVAVKKGANISRMLGQRVACYSNEAAKATNGDIFWDYINSIEDAGLIETYDLGVPGNHNFVANDIIVHNTWTLQDLALRGVRAGCNVAYFDAGDMDEDRITVRLHTRISGQSPKYRGRMKSPVLDCRHSQDDSCRRRERVSRCGVYGDVENDKGETVWARLDFVDAPPGYRPCTECARDEPRAFRGAVWYEEIEAERLTWQAAVAAGKRFADRSRKRLKVSCHANSTLTVAGMEAQLDRWEAEDGFVADLIVADYFDIFAAEDGKVIEERHRQNDRWKAGRRLTQQRHCALIAATQAAATSYDKKSLKLKDFSEAKTKYAHVTKFIFLSQTPAEKRDMVIRAAMALAREDDFDIEREVVVMRNLRLGQSYMGSFFA